jgi:4-amino-4-deoxy-L-arabinose transferase-like glycosyltransferase
MPLRHAHIDESVVVFYSLRVLAGSLDPAAFFDYPGFMLYALSGLFRAAAGIARLAGQVGDLSSLLAAHLAGDSDLFFLTGRLFSAAAGTLAVLLTYRIGTRWDGRFTGTAAAALLATDRLNVQHAHYATTDVVAALFTLAAVHLLLEYWEDPSPAAGAWAAVSVGLAAATKYYPGLLAAALLPVPWRRGSRRPFRDAARLALFCAAGFLLASPYTLLAPARFAERFLHLFPKIVGGGGGGTEYLLPTLGHLWRHAGPAGLAAVAGAALAWRSGPRSWRLIGALAAGSTVFFGLWRAQLPHYTLMVYPLLFLLAAFGLARTARLRPWLPSAAASALFLWSAAHTAGFLRLVSAPDTRFAAKEWVVRNVPAGSAVLRFAHTPEFGPRDPYRVRVDWRNERLADGALPAPGEFDLLLYATYAPETDPNVRRLTDRYPMVASFTDPRPSFPHHPSVFALRGDPAHAR